MPIYRTKDDIPPGLQKYCCVIGDRNWFEHPFFREILPFTVHEDDGTLEEYVGALPDFNAPPTLERPRGYFSDIVSTKYSAEYLVKTIEPHLPKTEASDRLYWEMVRECLHERASQYRQEPFLTAAVAVSRSHKTEVLCGDAYPAFLLLSGRLKVWRGVVANSEETALQAIRGGYCWSLERAQAEHFANPPYRAEGRAFLASAFVTKDQILAYRPSHGEREVTVMPNAVKSIALDEGFSERSVLNFT